jgi:hypothetical protein
MTFEGKKTNKKYKQNLVGNLKEAETKGMK